MSLKEKESIFSAQIPIVYSFVKIPLKLAFPDSDDKVNHVAIMTTIGVIKGASKDYDNSEARFLASLDGGTKYFVKYGTTVTCNYMMMNNKSAKFPCAAAGIFTSFLYSKGWEDWPQFLWKSVILGGISRQADHVKKVVDQMKDMALYVGAVDLEIFDQSLYGLTLYEMTAFAGNVVHTNVLNVGKALLDMWYEPIVTIEDYNMCPMYCDERFMNEDAEL